MPQATIDTAAKPMTDKDKRAKRPAHDLNDKAVRLVAGATAKSAYKAGANVLGGGELVGIVWGVDAASGRAIVDFGCTPGGIPLRAIAQVSDLVEV